MQKYENKSSIFAATNQIINQTVYYSFMPRKILLFILFSLCVSFVMGQKITINGYVYERGSLETLPGTLIYEPQSQIAVTANNYGFYTITLPYKDSLFIVDNSFGFLNDTLWLKTNEDIEMMFTCRKLRC